MTRQSKETHQLEMILRRARYRRAQAKHIKLLKDEGRLSFNKATGRYYITHTTAKDYTKLCNDERREGLRV